MRARTVLAALLPLLLLVGCNTEDLSEREARIDPPSAGPVDDNQIPDVGDPGDPGDDVVVEPPSPDIDSPVDDPRGDSRGVDLLPVGDGELMPEPHPDVEPLALARSARRMDLDQLDASLRRVTGGLGWTEMRGGREVNLFVELSATLGKPDYFERTQEDLEPSALFQKFLGDAARSTCARLLDREAITPADARVFFTEAEVDEINLDDPARAAAIDRNLRALILRYHGRQVGEDAAGDAVLEEWRWLLKSTMHVTGDARASWGTLCVGLITHPDFYTY